MSSKILDRRDASMPFQEWLPFPPEAIVQVWNVFGESRIAQSVDLWWGHEFEMGGTAEGVIVRARRLDKPKPVCERDRVTMQRGIAYDARMVWTCVGLNNLTKDVIPCWKCPICGQSETID